MRKKRRREDIDQASKMAQIVILLPLIRYAKWLSKKNESKKRYFQHYNPSRRQLDAPKTIIANKTSKIETVAASGLIATFFLGCLNPAFFLFTAFFAVMFIHTHKEGAVAKIKDTNKKRKKP